MHLLYVVLKLYECEQEIFIICAFIRCPCCFRDDVMVIVVVVLGGVGVVLGASWWC